MSWQYDLLVVALILLPMGVALAIVLYVRRKTGYEKALKALDDPKDTGSEEPKSRILMTRKKVWIFGACILLAIGGIIADGYLGFSWGWIVTLAANLIFAAVFFPTEPGLAVPYIILALGYLILAGIAVIFSAIPKGGWNWLQPFGLCALSVWCGVCSIRSRSH